MLPVPGEDDQGVVSAAGGVGDDAGGDYGEAVGELDVCVASSGGRQHLAEHVSCRGDVVAAHGVKDDDQRADEVAPEPGGRASCEVEVGDDGADVVVSTGEVEGDGQVELEVGRPRLLTVGDGALEEFDRLGEPSVHQPRQ